MRKIVLVYHSIGKDDLFLQVPLNQFVNQIDYTIKRFKPRKIASFFSKNSKERNEVLIMFDDAFRDALPAMDYLEKKGIPFTVAVVDSFLHDHNNEYCSESDLKEYKNAEFVFHTRSHRSLKGLSDSEIMTEITPSSDNGLPMEEGILVYPKGEYDENVFYLMEREKYQWGLTCLPFHLSKDFEAKNFAVPRINVNGYLPFWKFRLFLTAIGDFYLHVAFIKRNLLGENYLDK